MNFIRRLFPGSQGIETENIFSAPLTPDQPLFVVGDIHGRLDLLDSLLAGFLAEFPDTVMAPQLVFVGDYVDRGESSLEVLNRLRSLENELPTPPVFLLGNHEMMLLEFLDNPTERGARWLRNGGLQTLASFGVGGISNHSSPEELKKARDRFAKRLPKDLENWLRGLPLMWQSGNIAVVHAAADPALPLEDQSAKTLIWGQRSFTENLRQDGIWIVHGHTIVEKAHIQAGRIAVDTGAVFSGRLSAALITKNAVDFRVFT